jgi:DNA modification methylase
MKENLDLFGNVIITDPILRERFMEPPFSVLDTKCGSWQNRKKQWKQLGIESHIGRANEDTGMKKSISDEEWEKKYGRKVQPFVSIFDPALCELIYNWYCPEGGEILDPFAGGSVRGIVANKLGYKYTGIDIRQEQIDSNREQALNILDINNQPQWYVGDSNKVLNNLTKEFDFVFSCPPYADLEVYSDLKEDISNMEYNEFLSMYSEIIIKSINRLKNGGYACFIVGDIRDKKGFYRDFISHTKKAFIDAGAGLYNEAILLQPLGTAMLRAGKIFEAGKKLTKVHENVLIFKKI